MPVPTGATTGLWTGTETEIDSLVQGYQLVDPRLYLILTKLNKQVGAITEELAPLISTLILTASTAEPAFAVTNFQAVSTGSTIRLTWDTVGAVASITLYEVRRGVDWDSASYQFRVTGNSADIDPLPYGSYTFLLKTISSTGVYSSGTASLVFLVPLIPAVTISKTIIDNNVLLSWTVPPSTFTIREYSLYRDGILIGTTVSTFSAFFEAVSGTYTYSITATDIAGNVSAEAFISVTVSTPPDYALQDVRVSTLLGTRVNVLLTTGPKLLCCWAPEEFGDHFTTRSWLDPQDQVDDGYPIYIQPAALTGSYEEVFDYGTVISNIISSVTWNENILTPGHAVTTVVKIAVSPDDVTYTSFVSGASQYYPSFRYLKLRLEFTGADDQALIEVYNLTLNLTVKREMDGGEVSALASDVGGTEVIFNKPFKDIESITTTVKSVTEPFISIYDFTDIPDPVHFFVFAFDTTGNRVSKTVEWKARGIV